MPSAEGKTFTFDDQSHIDPELLESIEYTGNPQRIKYETGEFSAVCPFSGLPDIAVVEIEYIPAGKIIELKSLKYYFTSYRNVGVYQEAATDKIYKDIWKCVEPSFLSIKTVYNVRGGILATCIMDSDIIKKMRASK